MLTNFDLIAAKCFSLSLLVAIIVVILALVAVKDDIACVVAARPRCGGVVIVREFKRLSAAGCLEA